MTTGKWLAEESRRNTRAVRLCDIRSKGAEPSFAIQADQIERRWTQYDDARLIPDREGSGRSTDDLELWSGI